MLWAFLHSPAYRGFNFLVFALTGFCPSAHLFFLMGAKPRLQRPRMKKAA
jgi:hypothetical protein